VQNVGGEISRAKMSKIAQKGGTLAERWGQKNFHFDLT
jgi:hypothetical protein